MKKKILLLVLLVFMTGCSAEYNIEIYNNEVREDMEFVSTNSSIWDSIVLYGSTYRDLLDDSINYPYPAFYSTVVDENDTVRLDGVEYYDNKLISDPDKLGQKLKYHKFTLENFSDSSIVNNCYQYFNVIEDGDNIVLSTSLKNLCFYEYPILENITINLKTNHKVVSSNANIVDGYHYTWNIDKDNKDDAAIQITIKKDEYVFNYENELVKKVMFFVLIIGIILGVGGICYFYFKNRNERLNKV